MKKKIKNFGIFESSSYDDLYVIIGRGNMTEWDSEIFSYLGFAPGGFRFCITDMYLENLNEETLNSIIIFYSKDYATSKLQTHGSDGMEVQTLSYVINLLRK